MGRTSRRLHFIERTSWRLQYKKETKGCNSWRGHKIAVNGVDTRLEIMGRTSQRLQLIARIARKLRRLYLIEKIQSRSSWRGRKVVVNGED
jgi:hypothetical protein